LIANAVDLPGHPAVTRSRAIDVVDDSDLRERLVVTDCGSLSLGEIAEALDSGLAQAENFIAQNLVHRAALFLRNEGRLAGLREQTKPSPETPMSLEHRPHA
jgi:hypothetical protein